MSAESSHLARARREMELRFGATRVRELPPLDLEMLYRAVARAFGFGAEKELMLRDIRRAPWVFFERVEGRPPLASRHGFRGWAVRELSRRGGSRFVISLYQAWLARYPVDLPDFAQWQAEVRRLLTACDSRRCRRLREVASRCGLLDQKAPERLWRWLLIQGGTVDACLEDAGLDGILAAGGLVRAAFEAGCRAVREAASRGQEHHALLRRLLEFAEGGTGGGNPQLRFGGNSRVCLVEALLEPYADRAPARDTRDLIKEFLFRYVGDPRLAPGAWHGVSQKAQQVFRQWLVEETLEDFFRLLEHAAKHDETARRHWKYRQAFWLAYLRRRAIDEAWLAVGSEIDRVLRHGRSGHGDRYARLIGANRNHACLIFRIGKVVLTEWNHTGSWRMWLADRRGAPRLYRHEYRRAELVGDRIGSEPFAKGTHHGSENGRWQEQLADALADNAGVRVPLRDLMPR